MHYENNPFKTYFTITVRDTFRLIVEEQEQPIKQFKLIFMRKIKSRSGKDSQNIKSPASQVSSISSALLLATLVVYQKVTEVSHYCPEMFHSQSERSQTSTGNKTFLKLPLTKTRVHVRPLISWHTIFLSNKGGLKNKDK